MLASHPAGMVNHKTGLSGIVRDSIKRGKTLGLSIENCAATRDPVLIFAARRQGGDRMSELRT